jgi:hypothetical protein
LHLHIPCSLTQIKALILLNIVSFYSPLFNPEAFHTGNYTEITQQFGLSLL